MSRHKLRRRRCDRSGHEHRRGRQPDRQQRQRIESGRDSTVLHHGIEPENGSYPRSTLGSGPSPSPQLLTVIGKGLTCTNGATNLIVRLDGTSLQTTSASGSGDRQLTATVPSESAFFGAAICAGRCGSERQCHKCRGLHGRAKRGCQQRRLPHPGAFGRLH